MTQLDQDRFSAAAYIAAFLPELNKLAHNAGHDVLAYFISLAEAEAKLLCNQSQPAKTARAKKG